MSSARIKKISALIPADLLAKAQAVLDKNQTDTLIEGLREIIDRDRRIKVLTDLPKLSIKYDVDSIRQRHPR